MALSNIIDRLRANEVGFKQLILTADEVGINNNAGQQRQQQQQQQQQPEQSAATEEQDGFNRATSKNISELVEAIESNHTVHSVFLDHFFIIKLSAEDVCLLFRALGSLPKLEQFSALSRQAEGWSIPMQAVVALMDGAKSLTSMRMTSIGLVGNENDFESFAKALQGQSCLKEFCLRGACIVDGKIPLDGLLRTLSAIPKLEKIELTAMDLRQDLSGEWPTSPSSALRICYCSSLKSLELGGWVLDEDLVLGMAKALETNTSLRSLIMLDSNITNRGCIALSNMLAVNKTIERLDLSYNRISDAGAIALAQSLIHNSSLKEIGLFGNFQVKSRAVFLHVIQYSNLALEDLLLDSQWDAEMNFYLNLNRMDRRRVLRNEKSLTRGDWLEALVSVQDDKHNFCDADQDTLSYLFYFVMAQPHFLVQSPLSSSG